MGGAASKNIVTTSKNSEQNSLELSAEERDEIRQEIIEIFKRGLITREVCEDFYQLAKRYNTGDFRVCDILIPTNLYIFKRKVAENNSEHGEEIILLNRENVELINSPTRENPSDIVPSELQKLELPLPFWLIFKKCELANFDKNNLLLSEILRFNPTESKELGINILHFCSILGDYKSFNYIHNKFCRVDETMIQGRTSKDLEIRLIADFESPLRISHNSSITDICNKSMAFFRDIIDLDTDYDSSKGQIFIYNSENLEECQEKLNDMANAIAEYGKIISILKGVPIIESQEYSDFSFEDHINFNSTPSSAIKAGSIESLFGDLVRESIYISK